MISLIKNKE